MIDTDKIELPLILAPEKPFESTDSNLERMMHHKFSTHPHTWHPPTDLYETEEAFIVRVEVAGMNKEEFCVSLDDTRLDVSGSRPDIALIRAYHQIEIPFGNFRSTIILPAVVDGTRVTAEYHDGFLLVTLPKVIPTIIEIKEE
jgi:HSP20 family protein